VEWRSFANAVANPLDPLLRHRIAHAFRGIPERLKEGDTPSHELPCHPREAGGKGLTSPPPDHRETEEEVRSGPSSRRAGAHPPEDSHNCEGEDHEYRPHGPSAVRNSHHDGCRAWKRRPRSLQHVRKAGEDKEDKDEDRGKANYRKNKRVNRHRNELRGELLISFEMAREADEGRIERPALLARSNDSNIERGEEFGVLRQSRGKGVSALYSFLDLREGPLDFLGRGVRGGGKSS
jgi:hypothetical protein